VVVKGHPKEEPKKSPERLLTVAEVAEILNVHPNTVRAWSGAGLLPSYRIGPRRDRRFRLEDVYNFLSSDGEDRNLR